MGRYHNLLQALAQFIRVNEDTSLQAFLDGYLDPGWEHRRGPEPTTPPAPNGLYFIRLQDGPRPMAHRAAAIGPAAIVTGGDYRTNCGAECDPDEYYLSAGLPGGARLCRYCESGRDF